MNGAKARAFALSKIGQGYIYGAGGQICTKAFREQKAKQYPDQAHNILDVGAKWDGKPVWDCAQLTRYAAKAEGITFPSGATSQWNRAPWKRWGSIGALPDGKVAFVYREANGAMQHTGIAIGDGTCVHARGTSYGVVHQPMSEYAWTHFGIPWDDDDTSDKEGGAMSNQATVTAKTGSTVRMRSGPGTGYSIVANVPIGEKADVLSTADGWCKITYNGMEGYMMAQYLTFAQSSSLEERLADLEQRVARLEAERNA